MTLPLRAAHMHRTQRSPGSVRISGDSREECFMLCSFRRVAAGISLAAASFAPALPAQTETVDMQAMQKIRDEGFARSHVMEIASWLSDVYGPRLTGSPTARKAGDWTIQTLKSW
ncbi:MAG TPA: hypothetical protein VFJ20_06325, partial [Gemmatimonadaceae bacterium]|nr:hypothetical protein [Gemmatimonadaceae bacterium]